MEHEMRGPRFGVGPVYIVLVILLTTAAYYFSEQGYLSAGAVPALAIPLQILGGVLLIAGMAIWIPAVGVLRARRFSNDNKLITAGVFAWVRNPLYSGYMFIFSGLLCFAKNAFLLACPFIFWLLLSLLVRREEAGLIKAFGEEYRSYMKKVNRCIPWFPKR